MIAFPPSWPRRAAPIIGGLAVATLLIFVFSSQAGILREAIPLLKRARPEWLAAAALCQIAVYLCVAAILRAGLPAASADSVETGPPSFGTLIRAGGAFLWANRALPGPAVAGLATLVFVLGRDRRRPVPTSAAQAAAAIFYLADYAGFIALAILCGIGLWMAGRGGETVSASLPVAPVVIALALIVLGGGAVLALLRSPDTARRVTGKCVRSVASAVRRPDAEALADSASAGVDSFYERWREVSSRPGGLISACGWAFVMHVFETATLTVIALAFRSGGGGHAQMHLAAGAAAGYVAGNLAAIVSFLPAGLGFFEGAMGVTLHLLGGVSVIDAAAATIVYRILSVWLPLPAVLGTARQAVAAARSGIVGNTADKGNEMGNVRMEKE